MHEFQLIQKYFNQQTIHRKDVTVGIGDDCALVSVPSGHTLAVTTDTLISDIHFFANDPATAIGHKALAVNLSDLAAMGSTPAWVTLALTLPKADEDWLKEFCSGFFSLAETYRVQLIGGDLTHGPLAMTVGAFGFLPPDKRLLRSQAQVGDLIYVSGHLGDAGLALSHLQNHFALTPDDLAATLTKLQYPSPRIELGQQLLGYAHAVIDISDGLAADLSHILVASKVGATLFVDELPLSATLKRVLPLEQAIRLALTSGDDYELCFTVPKSHQSLVESRCKMLPYPITCIGQVTTSGFNLQFADGKKFKGDLHGYQHF